jgi:hypothetical protein
MLCFATHRRAEASSREEVSLPNLQQSDRTVSLKEVLDFEADLSTANT